MTICPRHRIASLLLLSCAAGAAPSAWSAEADTSAKGEEHEAMEVGGRITVDGQNNFHQ